MLLFAILWEGVNPSPTLITFELMVLSSGMLQTISDLYIETRNPGVFGLMPDGKLTLEDVKIFYEFAKEDHGTIQTVLSKR